MNRNKRWAFLAEVIGQISDATVDILALIGLVTATVIHDPYLLASSSVVLIVSEIRRFR